MSAAVAPTIVRPSCVILDPPVLDTVVTRTRAHSRGGRGVSHGISVGRTRRSRHLPSGRSVPGSAYTWRYPTWGIAHRRRVKLPHRATERAHGSRQSHRRPTVVLRPGTALNRPGPEGASMSLVATELSDLRLDLRRSAPLRPALRVRRMTTSAASRSMPRLVAPNEHARREESSIVHLEPSAYGTHQGRPHILPQPLGQTGPAGGPAWPEQRPEPELRSQRLDQQPGAAGRQGRRIEPSRAPRS